MRPRAADYPWPPSVSAASAGDQCMVNVYQLARSCQACQPLLVRPNPTLRAPWTAACRRTATSCDEPCRLLPPFTVCGVAPAARADENLAAPQPHRLSRTACPAWHARVVGGRPRTPQQPRHGRAIAGRAPQVALVRAGVLTAIARISRSSHVAAARRTGAVRPGRPFQPACERAGVSELPADALAAAVFHCFAAAVPEARPLRG
jgi:hypothetical protein